MKTWDEAKKAFLGDHVTNRLTFPDQTLRSFNYIEEALKKNFPRLLDGSLLFEKLSESELMDLYAQLKGRRINRHDKIVIKRLYKFSTP